MDVPTRSFGVPSCEDNPAPRLSAPGEPQARSAPAPVYPPPSGAARLPRQPRARARASLRGGRKGRCRGRVPDAAGAAAPSGHGAGQTRKWPSRAPAGTAATAPQSGERGAAQADGAPGPAMAAGAAAGGAR